MIRSWLTDQGFTLGPAIALILFLGVFLGVLVWVYRPGSRQLYEHEARLPLDDVEDDAHAGAPATDNDDSHRADRPRAER